MHDVVRVVRPGTIEDQPLLERIVAITVFWRPEDKDRSIEDLESYRRIRLYVDNWGRDGDAAVVAQDGDQSVGAAWYATSRRKTPVGVSWLRTFRRWLSGLSTDTGVQGSEGPCSRR